jgi:hypothetical protein
MRTVQVGRAPGSYSCGLAPSLRLAQAALMIIGGALGA